MCVDETKLSEMQKPHLDIDCVKQHSKDVSDDFSTGGHVDMLLTILSAFVSAITQVHGNEVVQSDILIYSSCRHDKISYHLIYPVGRFPRLLCLEICKLTCDKLSRAYCSYVDSAIIILRNTTSGATEVASVP